MIIRTQISFTIAGLGFDPTEFDLPWTSTDTNPSDGEGSGKVYFDLSEFADQENAIRHIHDHFHPQLNTLRQSGATYIDLFISWTHDGQCSGIFTAKELEWIANLDCDLSLDSYDSCEEEQTKANPKNSFSSER